MNREVLFSSSFCCRESLNFSAIIIIESIHTSILGCEMIHTKSPRSHLRSITIFFNVCWLLLLTGLCVWSVNVEKNEVIELAAKEAMASFNKDILFRRWNASHGGVYVPVTDETQPNPYLKNIEERDIITPSGKKLTLMNPAYMTRQVHELARNHAGILGHLTSLNPIRPENKADIWEEKALKKFELGIEQLTSIEEMNGQLYLRFMKRLVTEKKCLKCHAAQGYKEGDVRGGISASVPLTSYFKISSVHIRTTVFVYSLIWLFGLLLLNVGAVFFDKQLKLKEKVEESLRASEEHFEMAEKGSANGLWDWPNVNEEKIWWSEQWYRLLGYHPGELEASYASARLLLHPEDYVKVKEGIKAHFDQQIPFDQQCRLRTKSGEYKWFRAKGQSSRDESGKPVRMSGFLEDISLLKVNEARYKTMIESSTDGFWVVDVKGKLLDVNTTYCYLTGYNRKELLQMSITDLEVKENLKETEKHMGNIITTGHDRFETVHRRKDGSLLDVEISVNFSPEGGGVFFVFLRDLTERNQTTVERTMMNLQLQQAQKMEAIGTLAGGIAHDFNNILGSILGYAGMAREDSISGSTVAKDLDNVIKSGHRARDLVRQILAFSRQEEAEYIVFQPANVIGDALKLIRATMPATIEIEEHIDPLTRVISADPTQLHQILMNLCTNAFHAMEEKGGKMSIYLHNRDDVSGDFVNTHGLTGDRYVELKVCDSGPGISSDVAERIFEPYFTTKEPGKGTGMGLSIIHGLIKKSGGTITVDTTPGIGTEFQVLIPAAEETNDIESQVVGEIPEGKERILFVDDEKLLVDMGKDMLERLGYTVTINQNSLEALAIFQDQPDHFDLVITDQTMPGMTGADLSRRMLQIRPDIPIILCTGYSTIMSEEKAKSYGIKEFMLKPIMKETIAQLIRKVLDDSC